MEALSTFETSVDSYLTAWRNIPEGIRLHTLVSVAKSVCLHATQEPLNEFLLNFLLRTFTKMCRLISVLAKTGQQ
jgi:hypothetical protein